MQDLIEIHLQIIENYLNNENNKQIDKITEFKINKIKNFLINSLDHNSLYYKDQCNYIENKFNLLISKRKF